MPETVLEQELDRVAVESLYGSAEPEALRSARLAAYEHAAALTFPDERTPGWRRSDLRGIDLRPPQPSPATYTFELGATDRAAGIVVGKLDEVTQTGDLGLLRAMPKALTLGKFSALTRSVWQGGAFVRVPDGVTAAEPIIIDWQAGPYPRLVVILGKHARATVLERHGGDARLISGVSDLVVGEGSILRYAHAQQCGKNTTVFSHQHASVGRDAKLITLNFANGGKLARADVAVELEAPGAESDMLGLVFGEGQQQFDFHTLQGHRSHDTRSDLLYKSALDDNSHSSYTGVITIDRGAQRSDAYQANRNIMLSDGARADTEPMLEIEADDVRCTHGATVGPIDEETLFYVASRGMSPDNAARLIVEGFFSEVFEKFGDERVTNALAADVSPHLVRLAAK
ncbi:MAG: Fe-S cluster assembly protein SufD [Candidatus Eremiobacteraeota bacterium]|nr:Fe-S cluster assembly protein SufD [Candidatus Eremiobacteraeota bacterium]